MVFDHKGRLIKANTSAERILAAVGVELSRVPRLRVDVLDTSSAAPRATRTCRLGGFTYAYFQGSSHSRGWPRS